MLVPELRLENGAGARIVEVSEASRHCHANHLVTMLERTEQHFAE